MDSARTKVLRFNGNHISISHNGTDSTMINLDATRRHFNMLCDYDGPSHRRDPHDFASNTGYFVVSLMESKCKVISKRHCSAFMGGIEFSPEDNWVSDAITNWSSISQQSMRSLDDSDYKPIDCGIRALKFLDQLIDVFHYLHVDGYFGGMFEHSPMEPAPRKLTWDPVDMGDGDGDIMVHWEPDASASIRCRGARKKTSVDESMSLEERRTSRGLSGGGLGGPPEAPNVFRNWADATGDDVSSNLFHCYVNFTYASLFYLTNCLLYSVMQKQNCNALIYHLNLLGLDVPQAKRKPGIWELEPSGKRHKGITDIVETNDKLADMPRTLEKLCKDAENCHLEVTEKLKSPKGLDKGYEASNSLSTSDTEKPQSLKGLDKSNETSTSSVTSDTEQPKSLESLDIMEESCSSSTASNTEQPKSLEGLDIMGESVSSSIASDSEQPKFHLSCDDIDSLDAGNSVNDPVINWAFKDLMSNLELNGIYEYCLWILHYRI